nr:hypothetical protein [Tanacetum cinerariifolium]
MVRRLHQQDQTNDLGATPHMLASTSSRRTCQPTYTRFTPLSIPDDHVADFHYIDDARDIWNAVKARMQRILSQLNQLKAKPDDEDINLKFLRAFPSSWSQVALTLKTKVKEGAAKLYNLITGANSEEANTAGDAREFALMGVTFKTKLDNHLVQTEKWRNSSKNFFKLIDSSISVRTKVGLGFTNCISKNELEWDDSAFSVFTTNSEDVEGRPIFH